MSVVCNSEYSRSAKSNDVIQKAASFGSYSDFGKEEK